MTRHLFLVFALLVTLSSLPAAEAFFPMQPGNFWEYSTPDGKHSFRVRGFAPVATGSHVYYFVNGFAGQQLTMREEIGVGLKLYDSETQSETLFTSFSLDRDQQFAAPDRGCGITTGRVQSQRVAGTLPTGYYARMLQITYDTPACGEPVVESEFFVANIGMVRRIVRVGEETRQYDLVSARVGGQVILSNTFTNLTALTWIAPQPGDTLLRFRLETMPTLGGVTTMYFGTSQRYDLVIRDHTGKKIWQFSDGKAFLQVAGQTDFASYEIEVPLDQLPGKSIAPGMYTVDSWLTTFGDHPRFAASVGIVVPDFGQPPAAVAGAVFRSISRGSGMPVPGRSLRY